MVEVLIFCIPPTKNDVLPCVDDLLELIWQSRMQNAGITCGADYIFHDEVVS